MKKRTKSNDVTYKGVTEQFLPRQEQELPVEENKTEQPKTDNAEARLRKSTQRFITKRT